MGWVGVVTFSCVLFGFVKIQKVLIVGSVTVVDFGLLLLLILLLGEVLASEEPSSVEVCGHVVEYVHTAL